jgi:nucleoside-diphosphate-sugar epimerase
MKPTVICVTGGTGFIGQHLTRKLEASGVRGKVLTRRSTPASAAGVAYTEGDLLDYESLVNFVEKDAVVVHLAYLSKHTREENQIGLENLAKACEQKAVSRFVHVSTAVVVGNNRERLVTESTECKPISEYEIIKLELESTITQRLSPFCDVTVLRPTCVFGAGGQNLLKLANDLRRDSQIAHYLKRSLFHQRRLNLVSVENVVEALWFLCTVPQQLRGEVFIISEDEVAENNYDYVSNYLAKELAVKVPSWPRLPLASSLLPVSLKLLGRSTQDPQTIYSSEKLSGLGFRKAIKFQTGLELFVAWYKLQLAT